jgi:subtilisin family serine protease
MVRGGDMAKKHKIELAKTWARRVHPKLRMMLNGDPVVNAARAESMGALSVSVRLARQAQPLTTAISPDPAAPKLKLGKLNSRNSRRGDVKVRVFVETVEETSIPGAHRKHGQFAVMQMPLDRVEKLAQREKIAFVEQAENLKKPGATAVATKKEAPARRSITLEKEHRGGQGVMIGLIDVQGFDWLHPDFDDGEGNSRFVAIWDQGRRGPKKSKDVPYGTVITRDMMKKARLQAPKIGVSPHDLEPQSEMVPGSHGTHVASIAAGNTGVCSKADIGAVLISLPDSDRRTSFYDAANLLDAVNYLLELAGDRPISINISLGTNGHAHDGSSVLDRWIDALIAQPSRSICVAAGNAGQEREEMPGDIGYMLGRIHTSGKISAKGLNHDLEWIVVGDKGIDVSENELEIWYESQDRIAVSILPPAGEKWIGPIEPGQFIQNLKLPNQTILSIYNELYHPANGSNYIAVYLSPQTKVLPITGVTAGTWLVRLHGMDIRHGGFHGWIERDDPAIVGEGQYFWPSFFSKRSNVDANSVSSLACGNRIVSVANLDEIRRAIHITSSQGPTRDGRLKPDVAAVGTEVLAANGFGDPGRPWVSMTGTSMASPYVAGVVGLMLAIRPKLTAAQINGILKATAHPLPGSTYAWANDCGFGVIDPEACVRETLLVDRRIERKEDFA